MKKILIAFISLFIGVINSYGAGPKYDVTPFADQSWCDAVAPSAYVPVGDFSINETDNKGFNKNQTETIILALPAGFEFNTTAAHSVTATANQDITGITLDAVTDSTITITVTTDGNDDKQDAIIFSGFEVRAMSDGASGDLLRVDGSGGTFVIDGSTDKPTDDESLGSLLYQLQMTYNSSAVTQNVTAPINLACGGDHEILRIEMDISGSCTPLQVTQFNFNTDGDIGYSQNPLTNITDASVYYAGTDSYFSSSTLFGSLGSSPNGAFVINGTLDLSGASGTHYFFLAYDVPLTANVGDGLDANLNSFIIGGSTITSITNANPNGVRLIDSTLCFRPDLPNPAANLETIPMGSLVIPMDNVNQALDPPFNMMAYGLVHELLMNDIPVKWVIKSGKAKDDIDFTATVEREYPSFVAAASTDFSASAFVVDSFYVNTPPWITGQTATEVITAFANDVAVYKLTQDEVLDVRYTLDQRPKIAIFSNGGNQGIHQTILDGAGITNYTIIDAGAFPGISECYTFCSEPHWGGTYPDDTAVTNVILNYVNEGGNFYGQCQGVHTYENMNYWHTDSGIDIINEEITTNLYLNNDMAYMQFDGEMQVNEGGSEKNWISNDSIWDGGMYYAVSGNNPDTIVAAGAHLISPDSVGGNVFYLGGHDYAPYNDILQINAARLYLNASLVPAGRPTAKPLMAGAGTDVYICIGESIQIGGSPTGPTGSTFTWSPTTGLDDAFAANPIATPDTTTVYTVFATCDGCPMIPSVVTVHVDSPSASYAGIDQTVCANNSNVVLSGSVTGGSNTGQWLTSGGGTFAPNDSSLTASYTPDTNDINAGTVEIYLSVTNSGGCTADVDTMEVTITPAPAPDAGVDQVACGGNINLLLNGSVTGGATTGQWTTSGSGAFVLNDQTLNATYNSSSADSSSGSVTLVLTSTNNLLCFAEKDTMIITYVEGPTVDAGAGQTICRTSTATLNGSVTGPTTTGQWSTSGSGTFTPNDSALNATYTPSSADTSLSSIILTLTATNNGLCTPSDTLTIAFREYPAISAGAEQTVCENTPSATLAGSVSYATGVIWSGGTGTFNPSNTDTNAVYTASAAEVAAGFATLTATSTGNGDCLAVTDNVIISMVPAPVTLASSNEPICEGEILNLTATTLTGASYTWSGPNTYSSTLQNPSIFGTTLSEAGTYSVNANVGGCIGPMSDILVVVNATPIAPSVGSNSPICDGDDLNLTASFILGATYNWSGPSTFASLMQNPLMIGTSFSNAGIYQVDATVNGCTSLAGITIVTVNPIPAAPIATGTTICEGNSTVLVATAPGGTYDWYDSPAGGTLLSTGAVYTTPILTVSTTYYVQTTILGCPSLRTPVTVAIIPLPAAPTASGTTICYGNLTTLSATAPGGTYEWYDASSGGNLLETNASYTSSILYSDVTFYVQTTVAGCAGPRTGVDVTVTPTDDPIFVYSSGTYCVSGSDPTPTIPGGYTGTFISTPSGLVFLDVNTGEIDVSASALNTYSITFFTNGPCPSSTTINLTITNAPDASFSFDEPFCEGGVDPSPIFSLGASAGVFSASPAGLNFVNIYTGQIDLAATVAGTYLITNDIAASGGCAQAIASYTVVVEPKATVSIGPDQSICAETSVSLTSSIGGSAASAFWSNGSGAFTPNNTSLNTSYNPTSVEDAIGMVTLFLTTNDPSGICPAVSDSIIISIDALPIVFAGYDSVNCDGATVILAGTSSTGSGTWSALLGTGTFSSGNLNTDYYPSGADLSLGTMDFELQSSNNGACLVASDTLTVTYQNTPVANAGASTSICDNDTIIDLSGTVSVSGAGVWSTLGDGSFSSATTNLINQYFADSAEIESGVRLVLTPTNFGNCPSIPDTVHYYLSPPDIDVGNDFGICEGSDIGLFIEAHSAPQGVNASASGTGTISWDSDELLGNYIPSQADINTGFVHFVFEAIGTGCFSNPVIDTLTVSIARQAIAAFGIEPNPATQYYDTVQFTDSSFASYELKWAFGGGLGTSEEDNPTRIYEEFGDFEVILMVNPEGCGDTLKKTITINEAVTPVEIPNAFTPNGDGKNDVLSMLGGRFNVDGFDFKVFNEWGNMLFWSPVQEYGWDGTFMSVPQPSGTYVATFKGVRIDGEKFNMVVNVALIRD